METCNLLITIGAVIIGGLITWVVSWVYYWKAGKELNNESKELRKLINALLILQQNEKGQYISKIDDDGRLVTIFGMMQGTAKVSSSLSATLTAKDNSM
jgi:hypothetical protein